MSKERFIHVFPVDSYMRFRLDNDEYWIVEYREDYIVMITHNKSASEQLEEILRKARYIN